MAASSKSERLKWSQRVNLFIIHRIIGVNSLAFGAMDNCYGFLFQLEEKQHNSTIPRCSLLVAYGIEIVRVFTHPILVFTDETPATCRGFFLSS
jgi:hypothetical protein